VNFAPELPPNDSERTKSICKYTEYLEVVSHHVAYRPTNTDKSERGGSGPALAHLLAVRHDFSAFINVYSSQDR